MKWKHNESNVFLFCMVQGLNPSLLTIVPLLYVLKSFSAIFSTSFSVTQTLALGLFSKLYLPIAQK